MTIETLTLRLPLGSFVEVRYWSQVTVLASIIDMGF